MRARIALSVVILVASSPIARGGEIDAPRPTGGSALLVTGPGRDPAALDALARVLSERYGAEVRRLTAAEATTERVEAAVFGAVRESGPRDQVFVILDLALHDKGEDRTLVTSGFDPAAPWTGLPASTLHDLARSGAAGTVFVVHPDCAPSREGPSLKQAAPAGSAGASVTIVGACGEMPRLLDALGRNLDELADKPTTYSSSRTGDQGAWIALGDVLDRVASDTKGAVTLARSSWGSGAWLHVAPAKAGAGIDAALAALARAEDGDGVRRASRDLASIAQTSDATGQERITRALVARALDATAEPRRRMVHLDALAAMPAPMARDGLTAMFESAPEPAIRRATVMAWPASSTGVGSLPLRALSDTDGDVQLEAVRSVTVSSDRAAREHLEGLLATSARADTRAASARALAGLPPAASSATALLASAADTDASVRRESVSGLGRAEPNAAAFTVLAGALADSWLPVREAAAHALGSHWEAAPEAERATVTQSLIRLAGGSDENVVVGALRTLAKGGRREAVDVARALAQGVTPSGVPVSERVQAAAIEACGMLQDVGSIAVLEPLALGGRDVSLLTRVTAIEALGRIGDARAAGVLVGLAADAAPEVARAAQGALSHVRARPDRALEVIADETAPPEERAAAIDTVGRLPDPSVVPVLVALIDHRDRVVRVAAQAALAGGQQAFALASVEKVAASKEADGRKAAAIDVLGAMERAWSCSALLRVASASAEPHRSHAVLAIHAARLAETDRGRLAGFAEDASPDTRAAAAVVMGLAGGNDFVEILRRRTKDPDERVRQAAIAAIRAAATPTAPPPEVEVETVLAEGSGMRLDVFWCGGEGEEAARADAHALAQQLAKQAGKLDIGRLRVRRLPEDVNAQAGFRVTRNQVRYSRTDKGERVWAEKLAAACPTEFTLHAVSTPTPGYVSMYVCATMRPTGAEPPSRAMKTP